MLFRKTRVAWCSSGLRSHLTAKNLLGLSPSQPVAFLYGVCMFALCLRGFFPGKCKMQITPSCGNTKTPLEEAAEIKFRFDKIKVMDC